MLRVVVGRIAAVVVVVVIGVVMRIHRSPAVRSSRAPTTRRRRRQHRIVSVIVEAEVTGACVVADARTDIVDHPRLVAVAIPAEAHGLEVLEDGEAEELVIHFVVGHHRVKHRGVQAISRNVDGYSLDSAGADSNVLGGIGITVVGVEIDAEVTTIGVISDILYIIVNGDRIGVVGQHGL